MTSIFGACAKIEMMAESHRQSLYLDSNIFIDAYEGEPSLSELAKNLLERLRTRLGIAITSELSLAEVLVRPEAERDLTRKRAYLDLLVWSGVVNLIPVTRNLLYETAKLRAAHPTRLRLADSIHLATAVVHRCRIFVSRDKHITPPAGMLQMQPDRDGVDAIVAAVG